MSPDINWLAHPCYSRPSEADSRSIRTIIILGLLAGIVGGLAAIGWG